VSAFPFRLRFRGRTQAQRRSRQNTKKLAIAKSISDTQKRRAFHRRIDIVLGILLVLLLIIVARLIELQMIRGKEYEETARSQHFGGIVLPAKRGEILSRNSKTKETNIFATNTTLDLLYVDPFVTKDKSYVADALAEMLLVEAYDRVCRAGKKECPREFRKYYSDAFDPLLKFPQGIPRIENPLIENKVLEPPEAIDIAERIPDRDAIKRQFSRDIEERISEEFVSFVPLLYGATKVQLRRVQDFGIPGVYASENQKLIYANPLHIPDFERRRIARILSPPLGLDTTFIRERLRQRRLRYVPIFRRLPPELSKQAKKLKEQSFLDAAQKRSDLRARGNGDAADDVIDLLRGIALIPEHWRFYPDSTVASQVVGFLNVNQQAQNGTERTFDHELRGQEGRISTLTDPFGGQIVSDDQTIVQARDGKSVILTIDRFLQKQVENILQKALDDFEADSGQALITDPHTGRIIVMANVPLLDSNNYSTVYEKIPHVLTEDEEPAIVVEIYHPQLNDLVIRSYINDLSPEGRARLSKELQGELRDIERLYDLEDLKRYYLYIGENSRIELFPVHAADGTRKWLKYKNRIGVGAYINRTIQEIYEPGSVFKPITMSIALDQGEITPDELYMDTGLVEIDEYKIANAEGRVFDEVTMTDCLSYSVNTCMTHVSRKLGKKLFENYIRRFGFGKITGVQLEDEKPGQVLDWRRWSDALLATAAYGQGISSTPLQLVTAFGALANGGKIVKPTIIDSWIEPDGTIVPVHPQILEQVITEESAATVSAMLAKGMNEGFAKTAKVEGYRMAGKTGTSQIAGPGGKYEEAGSGTSITSFAGYAPVDQPKFVMMVKFDRPRALEYGSQTAAPVFKDIAALLFEYYGIPPDER
jgi:cell division protein FtsI/penicillin-binding protein 2